MINSEPSARWRWVVLQVRTLGLTYDDGKTQLSALLTGRSL